MTVVYLAKDDVEKGRPAHRAQVAQTVALAQPSAAQAFRLLECIERLWRDSSMHRAAPTSYLFAYSMPAILLNQYLLVLEQGTQKPLGLCTWAKMDRFAEYRYLIDPTGLARQDWCSGDRLWLIDWIGQTAINQLMAQLLKTQVLPREVLRTLRVRPKSTRGSILSYCGAELERTTARSILKGYHDEYVEMHRSRNDALTGAAPSALTRHDVA